MKKLGMILNIWVLALMMGCSSGGEDVPNMPGVDDSTDVEKEEESKPTILTGKKAVGEIYRYTEGEEVFHELWSEEHVQYMEKYNTDWIKDRDMFLMKKFYDVSESMKNYMEMVDIDSYLIEEDATADNYLLSFSFKNNTCELSMKHVSKKLSVGEKVKVDNYKLVLPERECGSYKGEKYPWDCYIVWFSGSDTPSWWLQFDTMILNFDATKKEYLPELKGYYNYEIGKEDIKEKVVNFTYSINGTSVLMENKEVTLKGDYDAETRTMKIWQTYPEKSEEYILSMTGW